MSPITKDETIAVEALLELHTTIRVNNKENDAQRYTVAVEMLEPVADCLEISNEQKPVQKRRGSSIVPFTYKPRPKRKCRKDPQPRSTNKRKKINPETNMPCVDAFELMVIDFINTIDSWISRPGLSEDS